MSDEVTCAAFGDVATILFNAEMAFREERMGLQEKRMSGESGEEFGVDGAEEALDLAAALGPAHGGVDEPDAQLDGGAFEVMAGEAGAMVDVENVGNSTHRPRGIGLAPDRLPERESSFRSGRGTGEDGVSADRSGRVIDHDREPGPIRLAARGTGNEDVEFCVVGLPDLVRSVGSAPVHELVSIAIRGEPFERERHERWVERLHNV